jgi:DNA polymerase-3 subunit gamma/tau
MSVSYLALARRWRPRNFIEVVGQKFVVEALQRALETQKLHHAFLFTGTRGTGKTTLARLLAKALNCEKGISSIPCNECATCLAIDQNRFIDVLEIDAASRTKVEETKEILDNIGFLPSVGRFKIYIIDEVHMLSTHSFNALLKTLEEPPPYVKFVLATTDPQKLPETVISRCLQFRLQPLSSENIAQKLEHILNAEGISYEKESVVLISRAAQGSMRDALSILEQALALSETEFLKSKTCESLLGLVPEKAVEDLLSAIVEENFLAARDQLLSLKAQGQEAEHIIKALLRLIHQEAIKTFSEKNNGIKLFAQVSPEQWQLYYEILTAGQRYWDYAPDRFLALDMLLLRMIYFLPQTDMELKLHLNDSSNANASITKHATVSEKSILPTPVIQYPITNEGRASAIDVDALLKLSPEKKTS